jgi:hypothetical protein
MKYVVCSQKKMKIRWRDIVGPEKDIVVISQHLGLNEG